MKDFVIYYRIRIFKYKFKNQIMYFNSKIERVMKEESIEEAAKNYAKIKHLIKLSKKYMKEISKMVLNANQKECIVR